MDSLRLGKYLAVTALLLMLAGCVAPITVPAAEAASEAEADHHAVTAPDEVVKMEALEVTAPFEVIVTVNDFAPGNWTAPHRHGGPNMIMVLDGEITVLDDVTGEKTVYRPGEGWAERTTDVFSVGNDGTEDGRVVAVFLLPQDASLTTTKEGVDKASLPPGPQHTYRLSIPVTMIE